MPRCDRCPERAVFGISDWKEDVDLIFSDTGSVKKGCPQHLPAPMLQLLNGRVVSLDQFIREALNMKIEERITLEVMETCKASDDPRLRHIGNFILDLRKTKGQPIQADQEGLHRFNKHLHISSS